MSKTFSCRRRLSTGRLVAAFAINFLMIFDGALLGKCAPTLALGIGINVAVVIVAWSLLWATVGDELQRRWNRR